MNAHHRMDTLWVETAFSHTEVPIRLADAEKTRGAAPGNVVCCVIDVLRATTTIASAMGNGCAGFYPCASPTAARALAASFRAEHGHDAGEAHHGQFGQRVNQLASGVFDQRPHLRPTESGGDEAGTPCSEFFDQPGSVFVATGFTN